MKTPQEILMELYDSYDEDEDLQLSITLNPSVSMIVVAMEEYAKVYYEAEFKKYREIMDKTKVLLPPETMS